MKYSSLIKGTFIAGFVLSAIMVAFMYSWGFFEEVTLGLASELVAALEFWIGIGLVCTLAINLWFIPVHIGKILSLIRGRINKKHEESDTYIYTRELPNYNAAVAGALYDFKSTFQEDYVAAVLDLIAKGYILEREDHLVVDTKKTRDVVRLSSVFLQSLNVDFLGSILKALHNPLYLRQLKARHASHLLQ